MEYMRKPECRKCPHKGDCGKHAVRYGTVSLSEAKFDLCPKELVPDPYTTAAILSESYTLAYCNYYLEVPKSKIDSKTARQIQEDARRMGMNARTYVEAFVASFHAGYSDYGSTCRPDRFLSDAYKRTLKDNVKLVKRKYGEFSVENLERVLYGDVQNTTSTFLRSEVTAGRWIVGWVIRGGSLPIANLYKQMELKLDPEWLCIEDHYINKVIIAKKDTGLRRTSSRKRHTVAQLRAEATSKRVGHWSKARGYFRVKERVMPEAVREVLSTYDLVPSDFEIDDESDALKDTLKFWVFLGLAVQHYYLLRYVRGDDYALRFFKEGGFSST